MAEKKRYNMITDHPGKALLMFVIPVKMKWLGVVYGVMLVLQLVNGTGFPMGNLFYRSAIAVSLINFAIFYFMSKNKIHMLKEPDQILLTDI